MSLVELQMLPRHDQYSFSGRVLACLPVLLCAVPFDGFAAETTAIPESPAGFVSMYCQDCHQGDSAEGDLPIDQLSSAFNLLDQHERWLSIAEKIRGGEMPPEDELQPTKQERDEFLAWLDAELGSIDCRQISQPGKITIHRLNRNEYNRTIHDLTGLDYQPADDFPADNVGSGFDNIAEVLSLPPLLMEKYLDAAEQIVKRVYDDQGLRSKLIFVQPDDSRDAATSTREVLGHFARRAFRRPIHDDELDRLAALANEGRAAGLDYEASLLLPIQAILVSPNFLFRIEIDDANDTAPRLLNDYELASRLSYFLWSTMPDDRLFELADQRQLGQPEVLEAEVLRMLADEKAEALIENFAGQWLELRNVAKVEPDPDRFPSFNDQLRDDMRRETELFFAGIVHEDRDVMELVDADYTYLNERLAQHYGIAEVEGEQFRKVSLSDQRRGGILTHASILTLTSNPTRTSPVKRGKWILENLLGAPPPPPPAGVQELMEGEQAELLGTLRERMQQHREDPSCAVCHRKMDALGFGFENFDAVGAWRDQDGQFEIDPSGELPGGVKFDGPAELRQILKDDLQADFLNCLTEKMLTYALGRGLESFDRCAVEQIVKNLQEDHNRFSSLVLNVVTSEPFRMRGYSEDRP